MKLLKQEGIYPTVRAVKSITNINVFTNDFYSEVRHKTLEELGCTVENFYNGSVK